MCTPHPIRRGQAQRDTELKLTLQLWLTFSRLRIMRLIEWLESCLRLFILPNSRGVRTESQSLSHEIQSGIVPNPLWTCALHLRTEFSSTPARIRVGFELFGPLFPSLTLAVCRLIGVPAFFVFKFGGVWPEIDCDSVRPDVRYADLVSCIFTDITRPLSTLPRCSYLTGPRTLYTPYTPI